MTRRICTKVIWREVKVMFRDEAFMFFQTWLTWHVHGSSSASIAEGCCRPEQLSSEARGSVRVSHRCPIAGSSPLDFPDDRRPDKISAGEVSSCVVPAGRDMLTQPPLTGVSAIVSAYMLRRGAANPRFWSPYLLDRPGHFSPSGLGCTYP